MLPHPDALFGCSTTAVFTVLPDSLSDYNADFHSDPTESDPLYICEESSLVAETKEKGSKEKGDSGSGEKFYGFSFVGSTAGSSASALGREREKLLGKLKVKTEMCNSFDGYEGGNEKPNNGRWSSRMRRGKGKFRSTECPVWECSRRFFRSCDLRRHLLLECGKLATYSCNHCPRKFYRNKDLNKHYASLNMDAIKLESVHNIELPINDCDRKNHRDKDTDSTSRKGEEVRKRKRTQNKAVNTCTKCCKTFKRYGNLRLHVIYQCGKKPRYRCSVCAKLFHFKSGMERHFSACHGKRNIRTEWVTPDADLPEKLLVE